MGRRHGPDYVQQRPTQDSVALIDCGHTWCSEFEAFIQTTPSVTVSMPDRMPRAFCSAGCASRWLIRFELRGNPLPVAYAPAPSPTTGRTPSMQVREWAREQGLPVAAKARIPRVIAEAYAEAHP